MSDAQFRMLFERTVGPVLRAQGFRRIVEPDGWMAPSELFERDNRWFGAGWDWRDQYLDIALGRLFEYRDVMPRVIVLGPLQVAVTCADQPSAFLEAQLMSAAESIPRVLETFDDSLSDALRMHKTPAAGSNAKARRTLGEFLSHLGPEMTLSAWTGSSVA